MTITYEHQYNSEADKIMELLNSYLGINEYIHIIDTNEYIIGYALNTTLTTFRDLSYDNLDNINNHFFASLKGNANTIGSSERDAIKWLQYGVLWGKMAP